MKSVKNENNFKIQKENLELTLVSFYLDIYTYSFYNNFISYTVSYSGKVYYYESNVLAKVLISQAFLSIHDDFEKNHSQL